MQAAAAVDELAIFEGPILAYGGSGRPFDNGRAHLNLNSPEELDPGIARRQLNR
jgi:hypothetical protein